MSDKSHIEWTDATWNPILGCSKVSAGCEHCYAMRSVHRMAGNPNAKIAAACAGLTKIINGAPGWTGRVNCLPERLEIPLRWRAPRRIFVASQSDPFHPEVPDAFLDRMFAVMALTPQHSYQLLTKRPERMRVYLSVAGLQERLAEIAPDVALDHDPCAAGWLEDRPWPLPNVIGMTSVEDQAAADERIPALLETPLAVRGISLEPMLGPVDLTGFLCNSSGIRGDISDDLACRPRGSSPFWVICGGESGPRARPMHPGWVRAVRDQCVAAGVAFFFKQGSAANWIDFKDFQSFPQDLQIREFPHAEK